MSNDKICTTLELKQLAFAKSSLTAFEFARWIESKSNHKYTIVQREYINKIPLIYNQHLSLISKANNDLKEELDNVIELILKL